MYGNFTFRLVTVYMYAIQHISKKEYETISGA
jgi:hypothetical protein